MADLESNVTVQPGGAPATAAAAPPPPTPPATPGTPPASDAEPPTVEVGGAKHVPLSALQAEREKGRQAAEKLAQAEAYVQQIGQAYAELRPQLEFLQAHPELMKRGVAAPTASATEEDAEAADLAKTLDLYTPEGQPDLARAKKVVAHQTKLAEAKARELVEPWAQQASATQSAQNFQRALLLQAPDGRKPDPQVLAQLWGALPPQYTADERVAAVTAHLALSLGVMSGAPIPAASHTPLTSEPPGGRGPRPSMTEIEQRIADQRGIASDKWRELTTGHRENRPSVLED